MTLNVLVSSRLISVLMAQAGNYGLPGPARVERVRRVVTSEDLVNRRSHRLIPNELWVTDITEHPTRERKGSCAAVLGAYSRRVVGWSIDTRQDSASVINALDMAIRSRRPAPGGDSPRRPRESSSPRGLRRQDPLSGLMPSSGSVGDGVDNPVESFWSSMQIELLNRKRWNTRVELANALFDNIEIFYNRSAACGGSSGLGEGLAPTCEDRGSGRGRSPLRHAGGSEGSRRAGAAAVMVMSHLDVWVA